MFGAAQQELQVSVTAPAVGCAPWPKSTGPPYRLFSLTADGTAVQSIRLNCSDDKCVNCDVYTPAGEHPVGECLALGSTVGIVGSVVAYPVDQGPCLASLRGRSANHGIYSAEFGAGATNCHTPTTDDSSVVTLRHWGQLTATPTCVAEEMTGRFASLSLNGTGHGATVTGFMNCPNGSCTTQQCHAHVNAQFGICSRYNITQNGAVTATATIVFQDVAGLSGCLQSNPPAQPSSRPLNYPAIVIGSTLGACAIIWLIVSSIYCKGNKRPYGGRNMQGDEEARSPLFSGADLNASYASVDG